MFLNIEFILEWICFACSFLFLYKGNDPAGRLLIAVMAVTVIAETAGFYERVVIKVHNNHPIYNLSVPVIIILFLLILKKAISNPNYRLNISWMAMVFTGFSIANLLWIQGAQKFATYNYIAGSAMLVFACTLYFRDLIRKPEYVFFRSEPVFWIAAAILVLYAPKAILYTFFEILAYTKETVIVFGNAFRLINTFLSIIFFVLLIYSSVCRLMFRKLTPPS